MAAVTHQLVVSNLAAVLKNIAELSAKHGTHVRLVAVSKTVPLDYILACYQHGQRHFGENYADELTRKAGELAKMDDGIAAAAEIRWHFIGRIQSNKVKRLCSIPGLWCVESVGTVKHADLLQSALSALGREKQLNIFIQVNTSAERNKGGVEPGQLLELAKHVVEKCPKLFLMGLMTIGSILESREREGDENADFEVLRRLRDDLDEKLGLDRALELSMGMSADYQTAIKYGSTNVRVGSTIFGQRSYSARPSPRGAEMD